MDEGQQIMQIATEYFRKEAGGDEQKVQQLLQGLAGLVQQEGIRLVHIGDVLFLVMVKGKGLVEVHTIAATQESSVLAKNFVQLVQYLKSIGVKAAYTYSDDPRYEAIAKRTRLPFEKKPIQAEDGKTYTAFYLEL